MSVNVCPEAGTPRHPDAFSSHIVVMWCRTNYMGAQVLALFGVTSLLMWGLPLWVLYAFNTKLFPGSEGLSQQSATLWSGLLAVLSVNVVIVIYIVIALREKPVAATPQPDPAFLSRARASVATNEPSEPSDASQLAGKKSD